MDNLVSYLSDSLIDEIVAAVGFPKTMLTHRVFGKLFGKITGRLANLGAKFDQISKEKGLPAASAWGLTQFCNGLKIYGAQNIPSNGPLLVVSNHPGTYDSLALFANLQGHHIRCVSSIIPFLKLLPHAQQYFLFTPRNNIQERMLVLRRAIRHLNTGGTLVYFASGHRDPDPTVYPDADKAIDHWLNIFDILFKYVKDLKVLMSFVSGVISPQWVKHPITWLRKKQIDKQRLAEFAQVISQLRAPGKLMMTPRIFFGENISAYTFGKAWKTGNFYQPIINRAKAIFQESSTYFGDFLLNRS